MCFANSDKLRNLCKFYYQLFITVDDVDAEEASSAGRTFLMELNLLSSFEAHRPFPRGTSSSIQDVFQMMMKSVGGGLWRGEEVWSESCSFIQIHVRAKAASIIISKTTLIWRAKRGGKWRNGWTFFLRDEWWWIHEQARGKYWGKSEEYTFTSHGLSFIASSAENDVVPPQISPLLKISINTLLLGLSFEITYSNVKS